MSGVSVVVVAARGVRHTASAARSSKVPMTRRVLPAATTTRRRGRSLHTGATVVKSSADADNNNNTNTNTSSSSFESDASSASADRDDDSRSTLAGLDSVLGTSIDDDDAATDYVSDLVEKAAAAQAAAGSASGRAEEEEQEGKEEKGRRKKKKKKDEEGEEKMGKVVKMNANSGWWQGPVVYHTVHTHHVYNRLNSSVSSFATGEESVYLSQ